MGGAYNEKNINGYRVHLVDQYGMKAHDTGIAINASSMVPTSCCDDDAYVVTVAGDWHADIEAGQGGYFMVVPYQTSTSGNTVSQIALPLGTMTTKVNDVGTGTATKISQDLVM